MYRTAPFQNPATARTAGSCERTGTAKAPVLSPAIFLTGRFTLDSGGSVFQQSSLPSVTRCRQELKTCSGGHMDAAPAPFAPHSGSQGQTGGFSTPFCETAVLFVNGIVIPAWSKRAFLLSALWPSGRKSGPGLLPGTVAGVQPDAMLALPKGRKSPPGYYADSILEFLPERH